MHVLVKSTGVTLMILIDRSNKFYVAYPKNIQFLRKPNFKGSMAYIVYTFHQDVFPVSRLSNIKGFQIFVIFLNHQIYFHSLLRFDVILKNSLVSKKIFLITWIYPLARYVSLPVKKIKNKNKNCHVV